MEQDDVANERVDVKEGPMPDEASVPSNVLSGSGTSKEIIGGPEVDGKHLWFFRGHKTTDRVKLAVPSWASLLLIQFNTWLKIGMLGFWTFFTKTIKVYFKWLAQQAKEGYEEGQKIGKGEKKVSADLFKVEPYKEEAK